MAELTAFRDAIVVPLSQTDPEKWPMRSGRVAKVVGNELAREFFADVAQLQGEGWTRSQIAALFGNPSRLWRFAHHLLAGLRAAGASLSEQQESMLTLLDLAAALKVDRDFADGRNLILTGPQIAELEQRARGIGDDGRAAVEALARRAHRAAAALWSYAEALYFVAHELGVEIHGPYAGRDGSVVVVRDFFRPAPSELWPELKGLLSFEHIQVVVVYDRFDGWLDVYNNLYLGPSFSLIPHTKAAGVWRDGVLLSINDLDQLCRDASSVIAELSRLVESWAIVDVARRYVDVFWWRKRELALAARGAWRPPGDVLERITDEAIPAGSSQNPTAAH